jgi:hypothetical protein
VKKALLVNLTLCFWLCVASNLHSAEPLDSMQAQKPSFDRMLTDALKCIKMTPGDLKLRDDYVDADSFRLELIDRLMREPIQTMDFNSRFLSDWIGADPVDRRFSPPSLFASYLKFRGKPAPSFEKRSVSAGPDFESSQLLLEHGKSLRELPQPLKDGLACLVIGLQAANDKTREAFARLTDEETNFLRGNFPDILLEDVEDEFKTPEELDELANHEESLAKEMLPLLAKIDVNKIVQAGDGLCFAAGVCVSTLRNYSKAAPSIKPLMKDQGDRKNDLILRLQTSSGEIIVGGFGSSRYTGSPAVIIDLGGDDQYDISRDSTSGFTSSVIIDFGGDDIYQSKDDCTFGSGFFGVGVLADLSGDDTYLTRNFSLGSGLFGLGLLLDEKGDDKYFGDTFGQGAGSFGMGFLADMEGNDQYSGALFVQGFGFVAGLGALIDSSGNDNYFAGGRYKDILRYEDHYISLSQGFAYGLRPMMSGGIGMLFDLAGNDLYTSDIFGQGSSYWFSLGTLMDSEGNDNYVSFQYAQGAATHLTLGILEDSAGDDVYISHGVSQGCGHDLAFGILWDKEGNDKYVAESLSQGAGSANGFGILADEAGNDGYFVDVKSNTQGYGNPRRDYGSVGMLLDFSGKDSYRGNGADSSWWTTPSRWGVGVDR